IMKFGVEMGKTAQEIQRRISDQIDKMTSSPVSKIDVVIEGVETEEDQPKETNWENPVATN
ncbi:MAG: Asp23/Gls24 family envelope stress response protein, partial [Opitutae bacterium]|nr:Asp23/Gls24 family envelope stress response protein [Opitutae bacterium]